MVKTNKNRKGYKKTQLGWIPEDWDNIALKNIVSKDKPIVYGIVQAGPNYENGVPYIKTTDLNDFQINKLQKTSYTIARKYNRSEINPGDIVIGLRGVLPLTVVVPKELPVANLTQGTARISVQNNYDNKYIEYSLYSFSVVRKINAVAKGSTFQEISLEELRKLKVSVPFLKKEQRAIAACLTVWDKAIATNQKLIEQKHLKKLWLMQNLLTGKKRLKGFSGEWKTLHIRDVSKEVSLRNGEDKQLTVLSCTKYNGLVPSLEYFGRKVYSDNVSTYKIVPVNHFAYATNHIEEGSIGYQEKFEEALISPMYTIFKTDRNINDNFFYRLLKSHRLVYEYNARMEGSIDRRGGLRWDAFSVIKIKIPSIEEQTAIAQILQTADKEIELLQNKLDKLKEQKKGLMQVLLTGKKRLNHDTQD